MKKIFFLLASCVLVSCATSSEMKVQEIETPKSTIHEYDVLSEIEGPLMVDKVNNAINNKSSYITPETSYVYSSEVIGPKMIVGTWTEGTNTVTLAPGLQSTYDLRINEHTFSSDVVLCFGAVDGPILGVENNDGLPMIHIRHSCTKELINGKEDIYYDQKLLSKELSVHEVSEAFSIQDKKGYIVGKNGKEYVLYEGILSSPLYDAILTRGCCLNPHYFSVEQKGITFLALSEGKKRLVHIELR